MAWGSKFKSSTSISSSVQLDNKIVLYGNSGSFKEKHFSPCLVHGKPLKNVAIWLW
jgi:hypothetical protein